MASSYDNAPGKIFIGGISPNTTQDTIQKYFEQYGELCDCVLMQDKATGKSRCFGFVTYKDAKLLDDVLSKKHVIDGKEIDCKRAIPRDQQSESSGKEGGGGGGGNYKTKKLFVGGLTQTTTEEQFRSYFEQFGSIEDSVIMVDKETGKSRGFGFVTFDNEDSVDRVIERYNDNKIDGKWVECKKAQAKDVMQSGSGRRGGKPHSGGGRDQSSHQRHGRDDRSRGQGYYQNSPTSAHGGRRSSRTHSSHDNEGGGYPYQGGYSQGSARSGPYDSAGGPGGYSAGYDYNQTPGGYDPNYNPRGAAGGYNYGGDYASNYNASYPNPYQNPYNAGYNSGYQAQYGQGYGQQSYDPLSLGMMSANPSAANPNMAATGAKGTETMGSMTQMSGNPNAQYSNPAMSANYSAETGYNPASYGYPAQGDYASNAGYGGYSTGQPGMDSRSMQGANPGKYGGGAPGQDVSPTQMGSYPKQNQGEVGPMKGGNKKQGVESRYYQPY